ncbi:MAG: putative Ig domain-containing protein, partial [Microbacteriaceae bacterium]|nr:putative Ig domain-containing protein [Microbacteriaceae bacterium]
MGTTVYGRAQFSWTPTAADLGPRQVTLKVTDSGNGGAGAAVTASETIRLVVRTNNQAPVLTPVGAQSGRQGQAFQLDLDAADADSDNFLFTAVGLPNGAVLDPRTGVLTWTPDAGQYGVFTLTLGVTDGNRSATENVSVTIERVNRAPLMAIPAPVLGQEGLRLSFTVSGGDLDEDTLVYFVENLPHGATFNPETRLFTWTPGYDQAGVYELVFGVRDTLGAIGRATGLVQILNVNRPPVFAAPDAHQLTVGQVFRWTAGAADPDGAAVTFAIANRPPGLVFDAAAGTITWTPVGAQMGRDDLPITVSDGLSSVTQLLTLVVAGSPVPPAVRVELTPSFPIIPGAQVVLQVAASSVAPIRSYTLSINGEAFALDDLNRVTFRPGLPGIYEVIATVVDADGISGTARSEVLVRDPSDRTAPGVGLTGVVTGATVAAPLVLRGTVADQNLHRWKVEVVPVGGGLATVIAEGRAAVDGTLATLDPGRFDNGAYQLRVEAVDISGRVTTVERLIEINTPSKPLAYTRVETDFTLVLGGVSIPVARRYSSLDAPEDGAFGYGWTFVLDDPRFASNVAPTGREADGFYAAFTRGSRVYVTLPGGQRVGFTFDPVVIESGDRSFYRPAWVADPGVTFSLSSGSAVLREANGQFTQVGTGLPYNPESGRFGGFDYALQAADGTRFVYTVADGLREVWGSNGTRLAWT